MRRCIPTKCPDFRFLYPSCPLCVWDGIWDLSCHGTKPYYVVLCIGRTAARRAKQFTISGTSWAKPCEYGIMIESGNVQEDWARACGSQGPGTALWRPEARWRKSEVEVPARCKNLIAISLYIYVVVTCESGLSLHS